MQYTFKNQITVNGKLKEFLYKAFVVEYTYNTDCHCKYVVCATKKESIVSVPHYAKIYPATFADYKDAVKRGCVHTVYSPDLFE